MTTVFASGELPSHDELVQLYDSVGWSTHT